MPPPHCRELDALEGSTSSDFEALERVGICEERERVDERNFQPLENGSLRQVSRVLRGEYVSPAIRASTAYHERTTRARNTAASRCRAWVTARSLSAFLSTRGVDVGGDAGGWSMSILTSSLSSTAAAGGSVAGWMRSHDSGTKVSIC